MKEDIKEDDLRRAIIRTAQKLDPSGLSIGTSGNISVGISDGRYRLITPSGVAYETLVPDDIVRVNTKTGEEMGKRKASIEKNLHLAIARARPEFTVIIHTDAHYASLIASNVPLYKHTIFIAGGPCIPFAPYATPGSVEIGEGAVQALGSKYRGCILGQHGLVACGNDLLSALTLARWIEDLAKGYIELKQYCAASGTPVPILDEIEARNLEKLFETYGK